MTNKPTSRQRGYDFRQQLAVGAQGEAFLDAFFASAYAITPATAAEQRQGIDRHFVNRATGNAFTVEFKTDWLAGKTHHAFVETMSVDKTQRSGWAYTSQAEFLIYYVPGDELIYVIRFAAIRDHVAGWALDYRLRGAKNDGAFGMYTTWGLLVPLEVFERIAQWVYSA